MKQIHISFTDVLKQTIMRNKLLAKSFKTIHPNSKYHLDFILNEIIYILKTGISWRQYRGLINYNTLYWHFSRFVKYEIFKKTFFILRNKYIKIYSPNVHCIDSTFIPNKCGRNKIAYNKFYRNKKGNKISCITDINGIPLSIFFDSGNTHDLSFVNKHINDLITIVKCPITLLADKGYESKKYRSLISNHGFSLMIPMKKGAKTNYFFDKTVYKKRLSVEHFFQRIKAMRKIQLRYEHNFATYKQFVYLAASLLINID